MNDLLLTDTLEVVTRQMICTFIVYCHARNNSMLICKNKTKVGPVGHFIYSSKNCCNKSERTEIILTDFGTWWDFSQLVLEICIIIFCWVLLKKYLSP